MQTSSNHSAHIHALYRISSLIGKKDNPSEIIDEILNETVRVLKVSSASIALIDAENKSLKIEASYGLDEEEAQHDMFLGEGITGWVALQGKPLLAKDVSLETRYFPLKDSVRSEMAVPLKEQDEVIGVINVDSDEVGDYNLDDLRFLTLIASEAGRVVSRVWFVNQLKTKARLLQGIINLSGKMISKLDANAVIERAAKEARKMVQCRIAAFYTFDEESQTVSPHTIVGKRGLIDYKETLSIADSSIGVAIQRKKQIEVSSLVKTEQYHMMDIIADRKLKSMLCTPVIYEDKILGVINLYTDHFHRFNNDEKNAFQTISSLAAVAIQNARLYERVFNTEDILRKNERLTTLGLLAAEIAHEIRNPLTVIKLLFDSLSLDLPSEDIHKKDLQIIDEKLGHLEEIVSKVLEFGKSNSTLKSFICINELLEGTLHLIRLKLKQQNIEVDFKHSQNSIFIHANKGQIQQSVLNLIINSSQAMPRGGKISIRNSVENRNGKDMGCIYVKDSGTGIPEEMRDKIFDSFLTSKVEGNGLGLSIVRRILKDHDGDVKLIDSSSEGTTFKIFVPISEKDT